MTDTPEAPLPDDAADTHDLGVRTTAAQRELWRLERAIARLREKHPEAARRKIPPMPAGLPALGRWLRETFNLWSVGRITKAELAEVRRHTATAFDRYRTGAEVRKSKAALRAAEAQERMADVLASLEHGGPAVALLARLREMPGETRPLPFRRSMPTTPPQENGT